MDFDLLPPEINSLRMYSGPGSSPLIAAATAWSGLADELNTSAVNYGSVITGLTSGVWRGPSALAMTQAADGYLTWLHRTAAHAAQTAAQATTAANAYQTAFAMTVPPPLIAANRTQLLSLIAANIFGQNSTAIAATEAHYEQMWARDVAAMQSYALSASGASKLTPFAAPPPTTTAAGPVTTAAVAAAPAAATPSLLMYLLQVPSLTSAAASTSSSSFSGASIQTTNHALAVNALRDQDQGIGPFWVGATRPVAAAGLPGPARPAVSAVLGRASLAGRLSVPQTWAATVRPVTPAAVALPGAGPAPAAVPTLPAGMPAGGMFGEALLGTLAGRGISGSAGKRRRPSVVPRSPAAG